MQKPVTDLWVIPGGVVLYNLQEVLYLKNQYGDAVEFIPASPADIIRAIEYKNDELELQ